MGDTPLGATSWADAGHLLGRLVRDVLEAGNAFLVVSTPDYRYVQMHAHPDGSCYVEADSGAFSAPLDAAQHRGLVDLGWPPLADDRRPGGNYALDLSAPVDVYRLVLLLARTLADVYDTGPGGLAYAASECGCERF